MATNKKHNLRLTTDRLDFLTAAAHDGNTSAAAVLVSAAQARLERARLGQLPPGHGPKVHSQFYVPEDVWDAVQALAAGRHTDVTEEFEAAIDDLIAAGGQPDAPAARARKPRAATKPAKAPAVTFVEPAAGAEPAAQDAKMCPPHPRGRVHKGFCGACGKPVAQG